MKKTLTSSSTLWAIPFCTGPESLGGVTATSTFALFSVSLSINKNKKITEQNINNLLVKLVHLVCVNNQDLMVDQHLP